jgi:hypothetical protein
MLLPNASQHRWPGVLQHTGQDKGRKHGSNSESGDLARRITLTSPLCDAITFPQKGGDHGRCTSSYHGYGRGERQRGCRRQYRCRMS